MRKVININVFKQKYEKLFMNSLFSSNQFCQGEHIPQTEDKPRLFTLRKTKSPLCRQSHEEMEKYTPIH